MPSGSQIISYLTTPTEALDPSIPSSEIFLFFKLLSNCKDIANCLVQNWVPLKDILNLLSLNKKLVLLDFEKRSAIIQCYNYHVVLSTKNNDLLQRIEFANTHSADLSMHYDRDSDDRFFENFTKDQTNQDLVQRIKTVRFNMPRITPRSYGLFIDEIFCSYNPPLISHNLTSVYFGKNDRTPPIFANLPKVTTITIMDTAGLRLINLPELQSVYLGNVSLYNRNSLEFENLPKLASLSIECFNGKCNRQFVGEFPELQHFRCEKFGSESSVLKLPQGQNHIISLSFSGVHGPSNIIFLKNCNISKN